VALFGFQIKDPSTNLQRPMAAYTTLQGKKKHSSLLFSVPTTWLVGWRECGFEVNVYTLRQTINVYGDFNDVRKHWTLRRASGQLRSDRAWRIIIMHFDHCGRSVNLHKREWTRTKESDLGVSSSWCTGGFTSVSSFYWSPKRNKGKF